MKPIDAIRNGETGERFRKKSYMNLGKSKLSGVHFLALNDIVSSPKRFSIITIAFTLCMLLLLILSVTVTTLDSGTLYPAFGLSDSDLFVSYDITEFMLEDGQEKLEKLLKDLEEELKVNKMPAKCMQEMIFPLPVVFNGNTANIYAGQGIGTTMDMYEYIEGTVPQNNNEIAITKISADKIKATIGDTVTIKTIDGDKNYIITAFFQSMLNMGDGIKFHSNEKLNYLQCQGGLAAQIKFTDNPSEEEIEKYETAQIQAEVATEMRPTASLSRNGMIAAISILVLAVIACIAVGFKFSDYLVSTDDEPETEALQQVVQTTESTAPQNTKKPSASSSITISSPVSVI